jgi:hypothetical protein
MGVVAWQLGRAAIVDVHLGAISVQDSGQFVNVAALGQRAGAAWLAMLPTMPYWRPQGLPKNLLRAAGSLPFHLVGAGFQLRAPDLYGGRNIYRMLILIPCEHAKREQHGDNRQKCQVRQMFHFDGCKKAPRGRGLDQLLDVCG